MTTLGAEGTRRWYPFEGGCEDSVLEGGGWRLLEVESVQMLRYIRGMG